MSNPQKHIRLQLVSADLPVERQQVLKEQVGDQFARLNLSEPKTLREMVYILNQDNRPLPNVLNANPKADVVFSGFNATRVVEGFGQVKNEAMVGDEPSTSLKIDPTLRLGAYIELKRLLDKGHFKMRILIFVGDLNRRIREFLQLGFEVRATLFADTERQALQPPILITSDQQLPKLNGFPEREQLDLSDISELQIGDITFPGVINMEEEGGHYYVKDFTIDDTVKKILSLDEDKQVLIQEAVFEEKLVFVRTKHVYLVMEPSLAKIVHQRLSFDKMEVVVDYPDADRAIAAVEAQKTSGVADFLETKGYDVVNKILDAPERELMLVASIGAKLLPDYLQKEMKGSADNLKLLKDEELTGLVEVADVKILDRLTAKLQEESIAAFLARIPADIREPLILEFLKDKEVAFEAWRVIGPKAQKEVLQAQGTQIQASLMLTNTKLFKEKFPDANFNQDASYDSATQFEGLDEAGMKLRMEIFSEGLKDKFLSYAEWSTIFEDEERDLVVATYITLFGDSFFNQLDASYRKIIWNQIGKKGEKQINKNLKPPHKRLILSHAKAEVIEVIKSDIEHILDLVRSGEGILFAQTLFLLLKQFNKVESKTGLFKKITANPKMKEHRVLGITELLSSEQGQEIFNKFTAQIDGLQTGADSLICRKDQVEKLQAHEGFKNAALTVVEDIVDASLLDMFAKGKINPKNFDAHQKKVEAKLAELKEKLKAKGADDPVGGYLLETMMIMMNMASEAVAGNLDQKMLEQLDEREKVKEEVMNSAERRILELEAEIVAFQEKLPQFEQQLKQDKIALGQFAEKTTEKLVRLQQSMNKFQDASNKLAQYSKLKIKVAKTQQQLSMRFFELIRPLVLQKLRFLPAPFARVIAGVKQTFLTEQMSKHRLIFKFTDDELKGIAKRSVVFATEDVMLRRFILTCMQIDKLDNTLFQITGLDDLPDTVDLLFIGNDLLEYDFTEIIKEQFTVPFADDIFYKALATNEGQKNLIRSNLKRYGDYKLKLKEFLETEGSKLKLMANSQAKKQASMNRLKEQRDQTQKTFIDDQQKVGFLISEKETLDEKFAAIDEKFKSAKGAVTEAISSGGSSTETITNKAKEMASGLSSTLEDINRELAGLVFVKNVKDSVERLSKESQDKLITNIDQMGVVPGGKAATKHIVVCGDGMLDSMELQKAFEPAVKAYFGAGVKFEELGLGRMEAEIAEQGKRPHLLIIIGNDEKNNFATFKDLAKRLKGMSPDSCILFFTGYTLNEDTSVEIADNINALRNHATPINTNLTDYAISTKLVELFAKVAP